MFSSFYTEQDWWFLGKQLGVGTTKSTKEICDFSLFLAGFAKGRRFQGFDIEHTLLNPVVQNKRNVVKRINSGVKVDKN